MTQTWKHKCFCLSVSSSNRACVFAMKKALSNNFCEHNCYVTHLAALEMCDSMLYSRSACVFLIPKPHTSSSVSSHGPEWSRCAGLQSKIKLWMLFCSFPGTSRGLDSIAQTCGRNWNLGITFAASVLTWSSSDSRWEKTMLTSFLLIHKQTSEMCSFPKDIANAGVQEAQRHGHMERGRGWPGALLP